MSDTPAFFSKQFGRSGLAPTVGLGISLYVIKATFVHPITKSATALPSHHWVLLEESGNTIMSLGRASDAGGVSIINDVQDPGPTNLILAFVPASPVVRNAFLDTDEAWIDLDKNDWASPQPDRSKIERRSLYRIPAWTTRRKAIRGGGFKDWPTNARPESRERGSLTREEVLRHPYGTLSKPWDMAIDFGWARAIVRYFYFDWARDKQNVLPPGLFIDVVPSVRDAGLGRLGTGTAVIAANGAAHMLIDGSPAAWSGAHIEFRAPADSRVDLAAAEPAVGTADTRLTAETPCPEDPYLRSRLPMQWHSLGQRCVARLKSGKVLGRASWFEISSQLAREGGAADDVTIDFHLDDVALRNGDGTATGLAGRPALFDHFLSILDPVSARPHQSDTTVDQSVVAADKVFTIGKPLSSGRRRLEASTRLIHIDGKLFDLRDGRVEGTLGRTACLGARAAFHNHHPNVSLRSGNPFLEKCGFYEIHLIDVPGVMDPLSKEQLMHMLLFVSCKLDENGVGDSVVTDFHRMLAKAADRWSQGSPGVAGVTKDYRILAKDRAKRGSLTVRPRAYFGQATSNAIMDIVLEQGGTRTNTADPIWFLLAAKLTYFSGNIATDVNGSGGLGEDSDGVGVAWHTLAHEFGHVFGLPDEYGENLRPESVGLPAQQGVNNPRVLTYAPPKEGMPSDYRPFYGDIDAIMNQNRLPRLRHYWHHIAVLNTHDAFKSLLDRPFVLRHETLGGSGIEYVRPNDDHQKHPFAPVFAEKPIGGLGKGDCALFPIRDDEGVVEAMFVPVGSPARPTLPVTGRFDAILVVRARVRFRFDSVVAPSDRWQAIFTNFIEKLYDAQHRQRVRFALQGGAKRSHIAIVLQPHCAVGTDLFSSDDIALEISTKKPVGPNPFAIGTTSAVKLDISHFDVNCVLRMILGRPTMRANPPGPPVANTLPLVAPDFDNLAKLVDRELGDPAGTRIVVPV